MQTDIETIKINGIDYVRADQVKDGKPNGNRAVIVVDRGWIFAGDVERTDDRIYLTRSVWVFKWSSIGFSAVIDNPKSDEVDIRKIDDLDIPESSEIFCIPVSDNWGLE